MTLRRPAAHLRKPPAWRRSGYESNWESLMAEEREFSSAYHPLRAPRPQSAIEGGQLDRWLEHLQRMQKELLGVRDQVPALTASAGHAWNPTFSGASSSCGSPRLQSSYGSQESLQTEGISPPECKGSWEKARITQVANKEQTQLSCIAPVKIGWLPIQRRVTVAADSKQVLDNSAGQVKLKQPITPTIQSNQVTANSHKDEAVERSRRALNEAGVKTQKTPDRDPPATPQVPEKRSFLANVVSRSVSWQALRRGWNTNRGATVPGGSQPGQLSSGTDRKFPLIKTNSSEPPERAPTTSADPCESQLRGGDSGGTHRSSARSSVQPVWATAPACPEASRTQTTSAVTTIIPKNKAGFSSITISSRKVSRSESFSGFDANKRPPSPRSAPDRPMDPDSGQFTVQRKATIVKVMEQRVMSAPAHQVADAVVRRRKATIIKVTERRESYGGSKVAPEPMAKHPEYRHSFTEGSGPRSGPLSLRNAAPSYQLASPAGSGAPAEPNRPASDKGAGMHRSTLSLVVSSPPALAAPAPSGVSPRAPGGGPGRPQRPASCYGSVCGYGEPGNAARASAGGGGGGVEPSPSFRGFIGPPEAGQLVANALEPNGGDKERLQAVNAERRMSPSVTLIKAPDPRSSQSPEEVVALNAAAIIANIKLQRQLSQKASSRVRSEADSSASPRGSSADGESERPHPDQSRAPQRDQPHAAFIPLAPEPGGFSLPEDCSLQEALQRSRPGFISRSQTRVRELQRRSLERRELAASSAGAGRRRAHAGRSAPRPLPPPHHDNLFKPRDRATRGKEMPLRPKRTGAEVKKKEEEKKKELCLSNRQRMELFRKRLLDQILQRNNS